METSAKFCFKCKESFKAHPGGSSDYVDIRISGIKIGGKEMLGEFCWECALKAIGFLEFLKEAPAESAPDLSCPTPEKCECGLHMGERTPV